MSGMIDVYSTRRMLKALEVMPTNWTFVLDKLFNRRVVSNRVSVDIDIVKKGKKLAPFVQRGENAVLVGREGYETLTFTPPYIKVKKTITRSDLDKRLPSETPYGGSSLEARLKKYRNEDLKDLNDIITRRIEVSAVEAVKTGKLEVATENGATRTIDFRMNPNHKVTLTGSDMWNDSNSSPYEDLGDWVGLILEDGQIAPDILIANPKTIEALISHPDIKDRLDTRRIILGQIQPSKFTQGAVLYGYLLVGGAMIEIYSYSEYYTADDGTLKQYFEDGEVLLTSTRADFRENYASIDNLKAGRFAVPRFAMADYTPDGSAFWVQLESAPLPVPHQIDAIVSAKVF